MGEQEAQWAVLVVVGALLALLFDRVATLTKIIHLLLDDRDQERPDA